MRPYSIFASSRARRVGMLVALCAALPAVFAVTPAAATNHNRVEVVDIAFMPPAVAVAPGETVTWNHSATSDLHNLAFDDGAAGFPSPAQPTSTPWIASRRFDTAGTYRYYCQEHGGPGRSGMSGVVYVNKDGQDGQPLIPGVAPTASFTVAPGTAAVDQPVAFDAAGTSDPDDLIVRHEWDQDGDGSYELDTGERQVSSRVYSTPGTRTVGLRVTDEVGHTSVTTRSVRVTTAPIAALAVSPNPAQPGQAVTFDGSGSSDPDGTIARYRWDLDGDGSFETDTGTTATTSRTYPAPATLTVKLLVTDDLGVSNEKTQSLTISAPAPPLAPPLQPPAGLPITQPFPVAPPAPRCSTLRGARRTACMQKRCRRLKGAKRAACVSRSCRYLARDKRVACRRKSCRFLTGAKRKACLRKHRRREQ